MGTHQPKVVHKNPFRLCNKKLKMTSLKKLINFILARLGYQIFRIRESEKFESSIVEASPEQIQNIARCRPFTMTSPERMWALINSTKYISKFKVEGAIVECGVWRGGSMMLAALELLRAQDFREIYLFDTFMGMSRPGTIDQHQGVPAIHEWESNKRGDLNWGSVSLEEVKANLRTTGYPYEKFKFVQGKVEDTLLNSEHIPSKIALLRLDTDWYESTKIELEILFPRLVPGGVLILDDFGFWDGARKAVEEYFSSSPKPILFHVIDRSGRISVKTHGN